MTVRYLPFIAALYFEIDAVFEAQRSDAIASGDMSAIAGVEARQRLNDQAYFLLCWGQLESDIDERCREAIRRRIGSATWETRRAWDLYDPDNRRLSGLRFEDRVALVLDQRAGPGSPYARTMSYYGVRNGIAHGRLRPDRIDVPAVVSDFHVIQSSLSA